MGQDSLTSATARMFIGRAGGTAKVAKKLGVSANEVTRWSREGLLDEGLAIRLIELGVIRECRYGSPPRCTILLTGELEQLVEILGGFEATAKWLKVSVRTLRRYRTGKTNPPEEQADRVRAILITAR